MKCRHCGNDIKHNFLDLGNAPPSNAYLNLEDLASSEITCPLRLSVCNTCWLVQTEDYNNADDLFTSDYAYFSSTSKSWLKHASDYADYVTSRLNLSTKSFVVELASNDGYLLKNFLVKKIPCLGVEPTDSTAEVAEKLGIPVVRKFFGVDTAKELSVSHGKADLICGNNVYAHVPDINDFTKGIQILLGENGVVTLEFPHLMRLMESNQFDTVYHEHFSYLSLTSVIRIFSKAKLRVFDVQELSTHGGSLRVFGCHESDARCTENTVNTLLATEKEFGLTSVEIYESFQKKADKVKNDFLYFLIEKNRAGKKVAAYGAAAKGNTLMNYAGIKPDLIKFVCDAAPSKQGKFMPGNHLPIYHPDELEKFKPDWIVIFPWNIADEVISQLRGKVSGWGAKFVIAVPELKVLS